MASQKKFRKLIPKELRIDNIVNCNGKPVVINDIGKAWHTHKTYGNNWTEGKTRVREYSPLPLDICWLETLGFDCSVSWKAIHPETGFTICFDTDVWYYPLDNAHSKTRNLLNVHDVQNLFFALYDEELDFREK